MLGKLYLVLFLQTRKQIRKPCIREIEEEENQMGYYFTKIKIIT